MPRSGATAALAWTTTAVVALSAIAGSCSHPTPPRIIDGDTFAVGTTHYRLADIDAPELPGHCRIGRVCQPGDPLPSIAFLKANLVVALCSPQGRDYYGRTLVRCRLPSGADLGETMLSLGLVGRYRRSN